MPSVSMVRRTFTAMTAEQVEAFASAVAEVRQRVWPVIGVTLDAEAGTTLDLDASVHVVHL